MPAPAVEAPQGACPNCGYLLAGLLGSVCPECGERITAESLLRAQRRDRRRRWLVAMVVVAFILYAPQSWLLWVDYPWSEHRLHWLRLSPLLPGLPAVLLLRLQFNLQLPNWVDYVVMAVCVVAMLLLFTWLASRSRWWFIGVTMLLIPPSIYLGLLTHAIFRF